MLDEFPALGRLEFFETTLGYVAGYGVRAFLIAQSLNQIEKTYGPNNSILDHCHVRVAFATNDERTAKRISEALGTKTELRAQKNYTGHRLAPWLSHMMVSRQETQRPLMTPGEVMQLPGDDAIIMVAGMAPVRGKKLRYYHDRNFTHRVMPAPERLFEPPSGSYAEAEVAKAQFSSCNIEDVDDIASDISKSCSKDVSATEKYPELGSVDVANDKRDVSEDERSGEEFCNALTLEQLRDNSMLED